MNKLLKRSRILKVMTDRAGSETGFEAGLSRLNAVQVAVVVTADQSGASAGQAAAITALATAIKCFGSATLVLERDAALTVPCPLGKSLSEVATTLGAAVADATPQNTTHAILIGATTDAKTRVFVRCWWNGWIAGVVPGWDARPMGNSGNPLAGVFAGAVAVREVFASMLGYSRSGARISIASVWEPWKHPDEADAGPVEFYFPNRLWFIGLGHLGQGFLWAAGFLRVAPEVVLQDDQKASDENVGTGLLTTDDDVGRNKKTRIAARWVDELGWSTSLIERRHHGDLPLLENDPRIVIAGLDNLEARLAVARAGFDYMIDVGLGHGPVDFEGIQLRSLYKGADVERLWEKTESKKDIDALLKLKAYEEQAAKVAGCGVWQLAEASAAVPFVGAAAGALTVAQIIRVASRLSTPRLLQMELGSPEMVIDCAMNDRPASSIGSSKILV